MKAIVVTDEAAGTAGMTLIERPEPSAAINDVIVAVHALGGDIPAAEAAAGKRTI
jgi:NADPH:quinone reductase-like Zn-dependent oxidoreductase